VDTLPRAGLDNPHAHGHALLPDLRRPRGPSRPLRHAEALRGHRLRRLGRRCWRRRRAQQDPRRERRARRDRAAV